MHASARRAALLLAGLCVFGPARASEPIAVTDRTELVWEFDPYYTNAGLHIRLTDEPVPDGGTLSEREVYRRLFLDSLHPRLFLIEASVYPLPVLGTWLKSHKRGFYDSFEVGQSGFNLLESVTAGFQEPWALSFFVGSEMTFTREGRARAGTNRGYMGYLLSVGGKHIKDNLLVDDDWLEFEWKLIGEREFEDETLSWSYGLGLKLHGNPYIEDVIYLSFRRSNIDFDAPYLGWLDNANLFLRTDLKQDGLSFVRQELTFGKNFPVKRWGLALGMDIGLIYEADRRYSGPLFTPSADEFTFVLRPHFSF